MSIISLKQTQIFGAALLVLLTAFSCSGNHEEAANQVRVLRKDFPGLAVVKAEYDRGRYLVILEELSALERIPGERSIELLDSAGDRIAAIHDESTELIDADIEEGFVFTASLAFRADDDTAIIESVVIGKYDADGKPIRSSVVLDESNSAYVPDDRVRIAACERSIYLAVFKNDETTFLFSFNKETLQEKWSILIEPDVHRAPWDMTGGSYDCFGQLAHQYSVFLDKDEDGNAYVAIAVMGGPQGSPTLSYHKSYFNETLALKSLRTESPLYPTASIATKVGPDGERIYSTVIGTSDMDEIHGMDIFQDRIITYGRSAIKDFDDWDPYMTVNEASTGDELFAKSYNLDGNGIFFGAGFDPVSGSVFLAGTGGWSQNPEGASVSENSAKLLATVTGQSGSMVGYITLPNGLRQNQVNSVQSLSDDLLMIAGWENGPGTHSGDVDSELVLTDGFLEVLKLQ